MAEISLSKLLVAGKKRDAATALGNVAYAIFVLFCFWVGSQLLNVVTHAPGVFEHLMQMRGTDRPRIEMALTVGTIFGLIPFLFGSLLLGAIVLWSRLRRH